MYTVLSNLIYEGVMYTKGSNIKLGKTEAKALLKDNFIEESDTPYDPKGGTTDEPARNSDDSEGEGH